VYKDGEEEFGTEQTGHLTRGQPRPNLKSSRAKEEEEDDDTFNRSVIDTVSFKNKLFFLLLSPADCRIKPKLLWLAPAQCTWQYLNPQTS